MYCSADLNFFNSLLFLLFIYLFICLSIYLFIYLFIIRFVVVYRIFDVRIEKQTASEANVEALLHVHCNVPLSCTTAHAAVGVLRDYDITSQKAGKQPSNVMIFC